MNKIFETLDIIRSDIEMLPITISSHFQKAATVDRMVTRLRCQFASSAEAKDAIIFSYFERWKEAMEDTVRTHEYSDGTFGVVNGNKEFEIVTREHIEDFASRPRDLLYPPENR